MKFEAIRTGIVTEFKKFGEMYKCQYEELGRFGSDIKIDPDWESYEELERCKRLFAYLVRDENDIIIGYAVFIFNRHLHYDLPIAINDVFYLLPEYREGLAGYKFIKYIEKELVFEGFKMIVWSIKPQKDYSELLRRLGYGLLEMNYFRRL